MENHEAEAYLKLCGAVIRQALDDYRGIGLDQRCGVRKHFRLDAEDFLFTERLNTFLKEFSIDKFVSADSIRTEAGMQASRRRSRWIDAEYEKRP